MKKINKFLIILNILLIFLILYSYQNKEPNKQEKENSYKISLNENEAILFNEEDKVLSSYKCDSCILHFANNNKIIIKKDNLYQMYDLLNEKNINDEYSYLNMIDSFKIVTSKLNGFFYIIDNNGNELFDSEYTKLGKIKGEKFSNYNKDYITAVKDGNYGMINYSGEIIIPFEHADIILNEHAISFLKNGKWQVYENDKVKGYDFIYPYDNYNLVALNQEVYLVDNNNKIISNKLDLFYDIRFYETNLKRGLYSYKKSDKLIIEIDRPTDETTGNYETVKYIYNDNNNKFVKG